MYVITLLCTDTDGSYYNSIIGKTFDTFERAMSCIDKCIEEEKECFDDDEITIKEYNIGKQIWYDDICLTDYKINNIKIESECE